MTDAAHRVTKSTIEAFAREYLRALGGSIQEADTHWHVRLPSEVDVGFTDESAFDLWLIDDETSERDGFVLTPESEFTQRLLADAAGIKPPGAVILTDDLLDENYLLPEWLTASPSDVTRLSFSPYYDRIAVCLFVEIGVETVSAYQTAFLEAVSIDTSSKQSLPHLTETIVDSLFDPVRCRSDSPRSADELATTTDELEATLATGQEAALAGVREEIEGIRRMASRAASAEFEEYRQLREQQLDDLRGELRSVENALTEVATRAADTDSQVQRVDALQRRKRLRSDKQRLNEQRREWLREKEGGYRRKRQEVDDRHAIAVTTKPIAATLVVYERGELALELRREGSSGSTRVPYALGAGVVGDVRCDRCSQPLSEDNPIRLLPSGIGCRSCA